MKFTNRINSGETVRGSEQHLTHKGRADSDPILAYCSPKSEAVPKQSLSLVQDGIIANNSGSNQTSNKHVSRCPDVAADTPRFLSKKTEKSKRLDQRQLDPVWCRILGHRWMSEHRSPGKSEPDSAKNLEEAQSENSA